MALSAQRFFSMLAGHLTARRDALAQLAPMAAVERWIQFEAASLLASPAGRKTCGIAGGPSENPRWWVTCEHKRVDLLVHASHTAAAVEFKSVHNNKNFDGRIREIRWDLEKPLPPGLGVTRRSAVALITYARYPNSKRYTPLRKRPRGPLVESAEFKKWVRVALRSGEKKYNGLARAKISRWEQLTKLDGCAYVEAGCEGYVALALITRA